MKYLPPGSMVNMKIMVLRNVMCDVTLVFNTPQPYKEGKKLPEHVHYIVEE